VLVYSSRNHNLLFPTPCPKNATRVLKCESYCQQNDKTDERTDQNSSSQTEIQKTVQMMPPAAYPCHYSKHLILNHKTKYYFCLQWRRKGKWISCGSLSMPHLVERLKKLRKKGWIKKKALEGNFWKGQWRDSALSLVVPYCNIKNSHYKRRYTV
jgi:hypothetical protein